MGSADTVWIARLRREQLLELLEGRLPDTIPVHPREAADLRPKAGELSAVWCPMPQPGTWAMPAALVVEEEGTADLFAWVATYLRPLVPLTAHTRILSPARLLGLTELAPLDFGPRLGGAVGLVMCEVLMHARPGMPLSAVGTAAVRSTLSYALARAFRLGLGWHDLPEMAMLFQRLRLELSQSISETVIDAILGVTEALLRDAGDPLSPRSACWLRRLIAGDDTYNLAEEVLSSSGSLLDWRSIGSLSALTAEERVRLLDEVAPLLSDGSGSRLERAFALALTCFVCRPGLEQQASLLAEYARRLPEAWLWLGAMQCRAPLSEVLSSGDGSGWWVARELGRMEDPFSPPRADIAAAELFAMLRGKSKLAARFLARARMEVELLPMVSVVLRSLGDRVASGAQESLPSLELAQPIMPPQVQDKALVDIQRAIENALRMVQTLRGGEGAVERAPRMRRKR